ncbi:hypothetical protein Q3G72_000672 [Acer saccharum]|nr:hypothetical protein Q3G72_000672 [Acer saccharum]
MQNRIGIIGLSPFGDFALHCISRNPRSRWVSSFHQLSSDFNSTTLDALNCEKKQKGSGSIVQRWRAPPVGSFKVNVDAEVRLRISVLFDAKISLERLLDESIILAPGY